MSDDITVSFSGARGPSNYELWLRAGNVGTVEDFLASLEASLQPLRDETIAARDAALAAAAEAGALSLVTQNETFINYIFPLQYRQNLANVLQGIEALTLEPPGGQTTPLVDSAGQYALIDIGEDAGIFWYADDLYSDQAVLVAAIGGTITDGKIVISASPVPGAVNEFPNGDFAGGTGDWAGFNGGSVAVVGGKLEITAAGALTPKGASINLDLTPSRCYLVSGLGQRGTISTTVSLSANATSAALGSVNSTNLVSGAEEERSIYISSLSGDMYIGWRTLGTTANGKWTVDNMSLIEVRPVPGFHSDSVSVVIEGESGAVVPAATQVIYSGDAGGKGDGWWVEWRADGDVYFLLKGRNTQLGVVGSEFSLGPLAAGAVPFKVAFGVSTNQIVAALDGRTPLTDNAAVAPGVGFLRDGQSSAGEAFAGTITRRAIMRRRCADLWHQAMTANPDEDAVGGGDSYVAGHNPGTGLVDPIAKLAAAMGNQVMKLAAGGTFIYEQVANYISAPYLWPFLLYHQDGGAGGIESAASYMEQLAMMSAANSGGHVFSPPVVPPPALDATPEQVAGVEAQRDMVDEIDDLMATKYGLTGAKRAMPVKALMQSWAITDPGEPGYANDQAAIAGGYPPYSIFEIDLVHLKEEFMQLLSEARAAAMVSARAAL